MRILFVLLIGLTLALGGCGTHKTDNSNSPAPSAVVLPASDSGATPSPTSTMLPFDPSIGMIVQGGSI